ncbi:MULTISPECIES: DUF6113 family protein [Kitasatospora]|uniref:DUF6113 family protein n=1 Tax=Kitasatospora cathayae TaxID=3004092 RepID=A0ABY7Q3H4_9ACTN|nr:DUF6113 family protein [Kitasatospora sp. HUAS 3-15]WBP87188.1 DUF6113 family protein [Kitasatospora sp. HUAS 3-15]
MTAPAAKPKRRSIAVAALGTRQQRLAEPQPPRAARIAAYVLFFLLGIAVSVCGSFVQALWPPVGVLLALAATAATFYAGLRVTGTRLGAALPAAGWFLAMLMLMVPRPEGDNVLWSNATSLAWLFIGSILGVICATLPTRTSWFPGVPNPPR